MIMYGGGIYGKVKSQNKVMHVRAMQAIAQRVSNIVLPQAKYDVFNKLRDRAIKNWGSYGMANDPRDKAPGVAPHLASAIPDLAMDSQFEQKRRQSRYSTRDDLIRQRAGAASLSMPVPDRNTRTGIASAPGNAPGHDEGDHSQCMHGSTSAVGSGGGMAASDGNPTVDDRGWTVNLSQIVGSGLLSQQQLQTANINNVYSMINADGMGDTEKREMAYYLQRFILEGYIRGVDVVREIKAQNGGKINIGLRGTVCGGGADGCGDSSTNTTTFRAAWWRNSTDKLKLALFYHEIGHTLLNRPHNGAYSIMKGRPYSYDQITDRWQSNNEYKTLMDELFRNNNNSRVASSIQRGNIPLNQAMSILNGGGPISTTPNNPNDPNTVVGPDGPIINNITTPPPNVTTINQSFVPPTINPIGSSGAGNMGGGGGRFSTPNDAAKTPVAGTLPDMNAVHTFAAGLQEASAKQSAPLGGLAGALTKFKHGA